MKYLIASDHAGYKIKEELKKYFEKEEIDYLDIGPNKYNKEDDFNDYAKKLVKKLLQIKNTTASKGILICGTGQGMCIQANRYKEIICSLSWNKESAKHSKEHLNANIISVPSSVSKKEVVDIFNIWKKTKFINKEKYKRRLKKFDIL